MEQQTGLKEVFLRLVAIVGLIAVLILGAWGIILLAFNLVGLFTGAVTFSSLFGRDTTTPPVATTTVPVVIVPSTNTGSNTGTNTGTNAGTNTNTGSQPNAVYTPAATRATNLYGLPDLAVTIKSVTSLSSVQGRTAVQFTVANVGTNIARSGWSFNAQLPLVPAYTYQSQGQQALYPGDSIAFTLTYDDSRYSQPCTLQYPNYNCNNYNQYPYQQYPYNNTGTCYTYNGYQNIPYPCDNTYSSGNPNYNYYNQNYNYGYYGGIVTIHLDPQNWVQESNEYNNTASKSF